MVEGQQMAPRMVTGAEKIGAVVKIHNATRVAWVMRLQQTVLMHVIKHMICVGIKSIEPMRLG
jgi:hypothetical protein